MVYCPACNGRTRVAQIYPKWRRGVIRRPHNCQACGHSFISYQIVDDKLGMLGAQLKTRPRHYP